MDHEKKELLKAWLAISLAFGIFIFRGGNPLAYSVVVAAFTVGAGFLLHELAHRFVARHFGKHAEFRANNQMLVLAIVLAAFSPIIFAAPGAVWISGYVTRRENGIISAAGPFANVVIAAAFLPLMLVIPGIAYYGFMINALLAVFNMLPIPGFDGTKVLAWSKPAYFSLLGTAILLNILNLALPWASSAGGL